MAGSQPVSILLTHHSCSWRSSMAEQRFCKPQVGGSIPLASSNLSSTHICGNLAGMVWCYYSVGMVVNKHLGSLGNVSNPGNPGNPGSPGNPGNRGRHELWLSRCVRRITGLRIPPLAPLAPCALVRFPPRIRHPARLPCLSRFATCAASLSTWSRKLT